MDRRLALHHLLQKTFTESTGLSHEKRVFFQPTSNDRLTYPCILYKLSDLPPTWANNRPYLIDHQYELTVIDRDPLSPLREAIAKLPECRFVRPYEADGLHHYVFKIYD